MAHTVLPQAIEQALELFLDHQELHPNERFDLPTLKERFRIKASQSHLEPEEAGSPFEEHHYASLRNAYGLLKEWITLKGPITHTQMNPSPVHPNIPGEINMTLKPKSKWRLGLPNRKLKTGEYLFYSGQISCGDLLEAVAWQDNQHQKSGSFAVEMGYMKEKDRALVLQNKKKSEPYYAAAIRLGVLSATQRNWLLFKQRRQKQPIGEYFVEKNILSSQAIGRALVEKRSHNQNAA